MMATISDAIAMPCVANKGMITMRTCYGRIIPYILGLNHDI